MAGSEPARAGHGGPSAPDQPPPAESTAGSAPTLAEGQVCLVHMSLGPMWPQSTSTRGPSSSSAASQALNPRPAGRNCPGPSELLEDPHPQKAAPQRDAPNLLLAATGPAGVSGSPPPRRCPQLRHAHMGWLSTAISRCPARGAQDCRPLRQTCEPSCERWAGAGPSALHSRGA